MDFLLVGTFYSTDLQTLLEEFVCFLSESSMGFLLDSTFCWKKLRDLCQKVLWSPFCQRAFIAAPIFIVW